MLLLDDCFAAVDTHTEAQILDGLFGARRGKTTIFVTHRSATAQRADRIAVLEDGVLTALGTHGALARGTGGTPASLSGRARHERPAAPPFEDAIAGQRVDLGLLRRLLGWLVPERRSLALSGPPRPRHRPLPGHPPGDSVRGGHRPPVAGEESPAAPDLGLIALTEGLAAGTGASPPAPACALYAVCQLAIGLAGHGHRMLLIGAVVGALARLRKRYFKAAPPARSLLGQGFRGASHHPGDQ